MELVNTQYSVPAMTNRDLEIAYEAEDLLRPLEQIILTTWHTLHGGVYTRTIVLNAGETVVGAKIRIPTTLVINGKMKLFIGSEVVHIDGTRVLVASANRKQIMTAIEETSIVMIFKTNAKTVEEAEIEFTDEHDKLMSRLDVSVNHITISGE